MASSSNFSKDVGVAEFPYLQDQSEVCTLSSRVSPLVRPYPPDYRAAFAFSDLVYPRPLPPSLRLGYHFWEAWGLPSCRPRRIWPGSVGISVPAGFVECVACSNTLRSYPHTVLVLACQ